LYCANVPEQKLLRITFFLLRPHDAPDDPGHKGNHENDPDPHMKWPVSAVAPTVHHPLRPHHLLSFGRWNPYVGLRRSIAPPVILGDGTTISSQYRAVRCRSDVRFTSETDMCGAARDIRFGPKNTCRPDGARPETGSVTHQPAGHRKIAPFKAQLAQSVSAARFLPMLRARSLRLLSP
jgi:hypothetical protein